MSDEARRALGEENAEALWPDGFDAAYIGPARRCGQPTLGAFSMRRALELLVDGGLSYDEALEHFEFNVVGAWMGPGTPIWIDDRTEDER